MTIISLPQKTRAVKSDSDAYRETFENWMNANSLIQTVHLQLDDYYQRHVPLTTIVEHIGIKCMTAEYYNTWWTDLKERIAQQMDHGQTETATESAELRDADLLSALQTLLKNEWIDLQTGAFQALSEIDEVPSDLSDWFTTQILKKAQGQYISAFAQARQLADTVLKERRDEAFDAENARTYLDWVLRTKGGKDTTAVQNRAAFTFLRHIAHAPAEAEISMATDACERGHLTINRQRYTMFESIPVGAILYNLSGQNIVSTPKPREMTDDVQAPFTLTASGQKVVDRIREITQAPVEDWADPKGAQR